MASFNRIIIAGNLGKDPELRYTQSETPVCSFPVAVSDKYKDKETTTWFKVTCWNGTAEVAAKYLTKGRAVLIEGRITTSSYEKDGQTVYDWGVTAEKLEFLGEGRAKDEAQSSPQGQTPKKETRPRPSSAKPKAKASSSDDSLDIPF